MNAKKRVIHLEHVGPIDRMTIPLPESGVVVLRGRNGVGKSHALAAVDSLVSGRGKPPCQDGQAKGLVEGCGARLTIGRSQRRTGEAEVVTLEGRLDISQLVQPPIKEEEAADRQRIKALIQLSGQSADLKLWEPIIPDGLDLGELVPASERSSDPVMLTGKIKRALEAEARKYEWKRDESQARLDIFLGELPPWVQPETWQPGDLAQARNEAQQAWGRAQARLRELETRQEMAARQAQQIVEAKQKLHELESQLGPTPESIDAELKDLDCKISKLEQALAVAKERRRQLAGQRERAAQMRRQAEALRDVISQSPAIVSDEEIAKAKQEAEAAQRAYDNALKMVQIDTLVQQVRQCRDELWSAEKMGATYREAAKAAEDILSDLVSKVTKRLRVEGGRLVCDTDRGVEPYSELSPGERWRIALEIAAEQVGPGGLITVPQEAWEGLDPVNRAEVAEVACQVGVVILTAEADEHDTIRSEVVTSAEQISFIHERTKT